MVTLIISIIIVVVLVVVGVAIIIIFIIIITIIIVVVIIIIVFIILELTHSKTILENTVEIEPQPVALDSKNFISILAVASKTVFGTCAAPAVISVCFNLLPNCLGIAPNEPTTNGMIFTLTFHIFCNSLPKS